MLTLVVERSTCRPGWALFRDAVCQLEDVADEEPSRTPAWLVRLNEALMAAGVTLAQIDRFATGLGPGSFSGTRASVAALQGMALPGGQPLVGVSSAAALAFALLNERAAAAIHTPVAVVGDARRERLWCAVYSLNETRLVIAAKTGTRPPTHDAADFTLTTWPDLPQHLPPGTLVVSPDWDRIGARLSTLLSAPQLMSSPHTPSAADVGRLLLSDPTAAHTDPLPIYLHPAVVEVRT